MVLDAIFDRRVAVVGACTGGVAGLVGITPACGFVSPRNYFLILI